MLCLGDIRDYSKTRHASSGVAFSPWLSEVAGRDSLSPVRRFEVMEITLGDRDVVIIVLQLGFAVVVEKPVESLLIVWPTRNIRLV